MVDIIVTACATIAGAAVGGLIPLLAARRQAQLNLLSTAFSNVFAAYTCFISSEEPRNPLPLVAAIEQARMLCGKNRFSDCDAALNALERHAPHRPLDTEACGQSIQAFRESAQAQLKRLM